MGLVTCKDCGKDVSDDATACPNCGAKPPKKTSKLTWIIAGIFALGIGLSIGGQKSSSTSTTKTNETDPSAATTATTNPKTSTTLSSEQRADLIAKATGNFKISRDKIEKISFFTAKTHDILGDHIYAYLSIPDSGNVYFRLVSHYYDDDWIFYDSIKIMADDAVVLEKSYGRGKVDRNNSAGKVWEIADTLATDTDLIALTKISVAKAATLRFSGSKGYKDFELTKREKNNLAATIKAYQDLAALKP